MTLRRPVDPRQVHHDFAFVANCHLLSYVLEDAALDLRQTESRVITGAGRMLRFWHPDRIESTVTSFADGYRHSELTRTAEPVGGEVGRPDRVVEALRSRIESWCRQTEAQGPRDERPWGLSWIAGHGSGWLRLGLPPSSAVPARFDVVSEDGLFPMSGELCPGNRLYGVDTVWYRPVEHGAVSHVALEIDYPGRAVAALTLGANLFNAGVDARCAHDLTSLGPTVGTWRQTCQALVEGLDREFREDGWTPRR